MWGAEVSEVDGKYLILYPSRDTSRVRRLVSVLDPGLTCSSSLDTEKSPMDSRLGKQHYWA